MAPALLVGVIDDGGDDQRFTCRAAPRDSNTRCTRKASFDGDGSSGGGGDDDGRFVDDAKCVRGGRAMAACVVACGQPKLLLGVTASARARLRSRRSSALVWLAGDSDGDNGGGDNDGSDDEARRLRPSAGAALTPNER